MEPAVAAKQRSQLPPNFFKFQAASRLKAVQQFISSYEYKQSPLTSFNSHKLRPLARIMDTAKLMVSEPQPIKCVEAVFLALYLTAGMHDVDRIPLSFKTEEDSKVHQHIVLLVRYGGKFGAFGISRRPDLMNKEFEFDSISKVIENYTSAYQGYLHRVLKIRIGLPVEHNLDSCNFICWRYLSIMPQEMPWNQCCEEMEKHALQGKRLWERWLLEGQAQRRAKGAYSLKVYSRSAVFKKDEEAIVYTKQKTVVKKLQKSAANKEDNPSVGSSSLSQRSGKRKKKRRRRVTLAAARLKSTGSSCNKKVVALKGRTIELLSASDASRVPKRDQFNGSMLRRSRPGKVASSRRKVCPLVPCRVAIASFG